MLGANLFFKKPVMRTMEYTHNDRMRDMEMRGVRDKYSHNNQATRDFVGHPRFGFHTMLNQDTFGKFHFVFHASISTLALSLSARMTRIKISCLDHCSKQIWSRHLKVFQMDHLSNTLNAPFCTNLSVLKIK